MSVNWEIWIGPAMARHQREQDAEQTPLAIACRALTDLRESLARMSGTDRVEIMAEMRDLMNEMDVLDWQAFGAMLNGREG